MKRTLLERVEQQPNGYFCLVFVKQMQDGEKWVPEKDWPYHRAIVRPGGDVDAIMAETNKYLERKGWAAVTDWSAAHSVAR